MKLGIEDTDIAGLVALSDSLKSHLIPPLQGQHQGTCPRCRSWRPGSELDSECDNCAEIRVVLESDPLSISVVSLYEKTSTLRDWLTRYKGRDDGVDDFDPEAVRLVRALLGRFVLEFGEALESACGGIDAIVIVPSTQRRPPHPLDALLDSLRIDRPVLPLLRRSTGALGFRQPSADGYEALVSEVPRRILLVDDVYTTGARLNSAAVALRAAGHEVAGALVVARRVNPDYSPESREFWDRATAEVFDWRRSPVCCPA